MKRFINFETIVSTILALGFFEAGAALLTHTVVLAACPENRPGPCYCPDTVPECPNVSEGDACIGDGGVLQSGNWDCVDNTGFFTQCVTGGVNDNAVTTCYIVYTCYFDGFSCTPNIKIQGKKFQKVQKVLDGCGG